MMSTNNILHPRQRAAHHRAVEASCRLYYLSIKREGLPGEGKIFGDMAELEHACIRR